MPVSGIDLKNAISRFPGFSMNSAAKNNDTTVNAPGKDISTATYL